MKEWIGKKVYVSDYDFKTAERYRDNKNGAYLGVLTDYNPLAIEHPYEIKVADDHQEWQYAVLAEEEPTEQQFKVGDEVQVCDEISEKGEWDLDAVSANPAIFIGMIGDRYMVVEPDELGGIKSGDLGATVTSWKHCRQIPPPKKKISKEEALAKLQEVYGEEVEIDV